MIEFNAHYKRAYLIIKQIRGIKGVKDRNSKITKGGGSSTHVPKAPLLGRENSTEELTRDPPFRVPWGR